MFRVMRAKDTEPSQWIANVRERALAGGGGRKNAVTHGPPVAAARDLPYLPGEKQ